MADKVLVVDDDKAILTMLHKALKSNGIDPDKDVNIVFLSEASEVAAKMAAAGENTIAMLPMPFVISVPSASLQ